MSYFSGSWGVSGSLPLHRCPKLCEHFHLLTNLQFHLMEGMGQVVCFFPFLLLMNTISISLTLSVPSYHCSCLDHQTELNSVHIRTEWESHRITRHFSRNSGMENLMAHSLQGTTSTAGTLHSSLLSEEGKRSQSVSHTILLPHISLVWDIFQVCLCGVSVTAWLNYSANDMYETWSLTWTPSF